MEWISVKDRLPELTHKAIGLGISEAVAVLHSEGVKPFIDHVYQYDGQSVHWYLEEDTDYPGHVTHWFPLPELPEEK